MSGRRRDKGHMRGAPGRSLCSKGVRWSRSPEFRAIALKGLARARDVLRHMPRCGAKARSTGEPCKTAAMPNGRCRWHGGLTPKGDGWHRIRLPKRGEAAGIERFDRKLIAREERQRTKFQRLAVMTPDERARHEAWQKAHRPGRAADRAASRAAREQATLVRETVAALEAEDALKLVGRAAAFRNFHEGVFG